MAILKNLIVNGVTRVIGDLTASKIIKQGGISSLFLKADGSVSTLGTAANQNTVGVFGSVQHSDYNNNQGDLITRSFMSYWNGAYNSGGASNLTYCVQGTIIGSNNIGSLSVKYATSAGNANGIVNSGMLDSQEKIDNFITGNIFKYATFKTTGSNNLNFEGNDGMILSIPWESAVYGAQMAFDDTQTGTVKVRGKSGTWGNWYTLLHSGNYNSYVPKLDGTGASGTWGINISGNAASASNVAWDNVSNKPTSLPANGGNADYATSAGSASFASKWSTSRKITLTGSVTGYVSIDGSGDVSLATTTNHIHNYLPLSGGIMDNHTSRIIWEKGTSSSWVRGRDNAVLCMKDISSGSYSPFISLKTTSRSWEIGTYDNPSYSNYLIFSSVTDEDYNNGNNKTTGLICFGEGTIYANNFVGNISWNNVLNRPSSFTPDSHTHKKSEITDFPASLPANGGTSSYVTVSTNYSSSSRNILFHDLNAIYSNTYLTVTPSNGNVTSSGHFYANSDIRYKNIIEHYYSLSDKIAQLPIIKYKWTDRDDDSIRIGSSALSVMSIIPELVSYDNNIDFYSLDYATLGAVAGISACKEVEILKLKIKELELEIIILKSKYNG